MVANQITVQELYGEKRRNNTDLDKIVATFVEIFLEGIKSRGN